jgi:signal transduction histidine kinase/DNA-binding response OmpR family regulator/ligand-binding sensor domain-containing protein
MNVKKLKIFLFLLLTVLSAQSQAQKITDYYNQLTEEEWLPRQAIRSIFQDSKGNLWVATNAGLYKYNLYETIIYNFDSTNQSKFLSNAIFDLAEDKAGNILVATESGLGLIDPITGSKKVMTTSDDTVTKLICRKNGDVWFINNRNQIFKIAFNADRLKTYKKPKLVFNLSTSLYAQTTVNEIKESLSGELLLATSSGVLKIDDRNHRILTTGLNKNILDIFADDKKNLLLAIASEGLYKTKKTDKGYVFRQKDKVQSGKLFKKVTGIPSKLAIGVTSNQIFASSSNMKANFYSLVPNDIKLNNIIITTVFIDRTQNIWLGTQRGLFKLKKQTINSKYFDFPLASNNVVNSLILNQQGDLIILTSKDGIYKQNNSTSSLSKIDSSLKNPKIIRKAKDNSFMLVDDIGLYKTQENFDKLTLLTKCPYSVTDMLEVSPNEWWVTTWRNGIKQFCFGESKLGKIFNLLQKEINAGIPLYRIIKDKNNRIWILTRGYGLFMADVDKNKIYHFKEGGRYKIQTNRLLTLFEDSKSNIWIGTKGSGLLKYLPRTNSFKLYDQSSGLPSTTVCSIIETKSNDIWVSTLNGVAHYQENQMMPFYAYGFEDGIFNPEFSFGVGVAGKNNEMYFGNTSGFYKINYLPRSNTFKNPEIVWTGFNILDDSETSKQGLSQIQKTGEVTLSSSENSFKIGFVVLDFANPEKTKYGYRLIGKDSQWKFLEGTTEGIQYLNLSSGTYKFQVKTANARGEWLPIAKEITINVLPSIWLTNTAFTIYFLIFISLLIVAWWIWKRWFSLNKKLKTEMLATELHSQQMIRYDDLSHEIKNRLTLIMGPLEQALYGKMVDQGVLNNLYEQALRVKHLTDQIMKIRKSEDGGYVLNVCEVNILKHIQQIFNEIEPIAIIKNVALNLKIDKNEITGWYDRELVEIILFNIITNAVKYSHTGGKVDVELSLKTSKEHDQQAGSLTKKLYLVGEVIDNGIGIPASEIAKVLQPYYRAENTRNGTMDFKGDGIGLNLVSRLIKIHHGIINIDSEPKVYTKVTVEIPIDKEVYDIKELKPNISYTPIFILDKTANNERKKEITGDVIFSKIKTDQIDVVKKELVILVVDDEPEIRKLIAESFRNDFIVLEANNGMEAMDILVKNRVSLVLSDLAMPEMDGLTLCTYLRNHKDLSYIPFILMTARNSEEQRLVSFKAQVDDFIDKPFNLELVKWRVKNMLRKQHSMEQKLQKVVVAQPELNFTESVDEQFIQKIINLIEENLDKYFLAVNFLADEMNMSRATLYRRMEQLFGESPSNFIKKYRLKKATLMLDSKKLNISEIAFKTGFKTPNYFSKCFCKEFGVTPSEYIESQ